MKLLKIFLMVLLLAGCAGTAAWNAKQVQDEFTDKKSCKVTYGSNFGKGYVKSLGGIHYYPFIETFNNKVIFGIHNDYNSPVGDVQIRIDNNEAILISYTETPVYYTATKHNVDLSYLKNVEGIDQNAMQASIDASMKNVNKITSPYTATSSDKAKLIINQLKQGSKLKMRIIGFGTNSVASTTGEYELGESLITSLASCGL